MDLLGTGDKIDPQIHGRVHKTRSSEELPYLTRIVEWLKAARLVRVSGTRLVPVKKDAALADKPFDLVVAMLAAYPGLGRSLFSRNTWRQSVVGDEFALIGPELLTTLLLRQGPCPMAGLELKEVLAGPPGADRDEMREWAGDYDPARFDLAAANAAVAAV